MSQGEIEDLVAWRATLLRMRTEDKLHEPSVVHVTSSGFPTTASEPFLPWAGILPVSNTAAR